jgi:PAS domain S-box-containing protein/putative nucleotidyltransferase with HDIG domain
MNTVSALATGAEHELIGECIACPHDHATALLLDTMREGVALCELILDEHAKPMDYIFRRINPAGAALLGIDAQQAIGRAASIVFEMAIPPYLDRFMQVVLTAAPQRVIAAFPTASHDLDVTIVSPEAGRVLLTFHRLTSPVSQANDELDLVSAAQLVQRLPLGYFVVRQCDGHLCACNEGFLQLFGYQHRDEARQHFRWCEAFVNRDDAAYVRGSCAHNGMVDSLEITFRRQDGVEFIARFSARVHAAHGTLEGVIYDITAERQAVLRLREVERRFHDVITNAQLCAIMLDRRGMLTFCNEFFLALTGWSAGEVIGKSFFDTLIVPEARQELHNAFHALLIQGTVQVPHIAGVLTRSGEHRLVQWNCTPLYDNHGDREGVTCLGEDITQREQAAHELQHSLEKLQQTLNGTVLALSTTSARRDPYTAGHQQRVARLAVAIAVEMGMAAEECEGLHVAGLLHDIGKIAIPIEILSKPGRLNEYEFCLIKEHPRVGFEILRGIEFPWPVAEMVLQHHSRLDGSGYPEDVTPDNLLVSARVLCVADMVEAISSHRPYRPALGIPYALEVIEESAGHQLDPDAVRACSALLREGRFTFTDDE